MRFETIHARARLYRRIRAYFEAGDCLEVDTPLLASTTNTDTQIASIKAYNVDAELFLQTSPEFAMKRLLAAGSGSIYQICHAFREAESGSRHSSEFTLLEWYRTGFDYQQLMDEVEQLIDILSGLENEYRRISYRDLFVEYTGIDIFITGIDDLREQCELKVPGTNSRQLSFDQCLDLLITLVIEPAMEGYIFVFDYPASQASLARINPNDDRVAERFELFYNGLELANGFSELTDATLQRQRFEVDNRHRQVKGLPVYPIDESLLSAMESGLPECAGVALGLDRLLMILENVDTIDQVMSF